MQTGYYGYMKTFLNDQDRGHSNNTYIDVEATHWFGGGFGAGLGIEASWSGSHYNNTDALSRPWAVSPRLSYGKTLTDRWGLYARGEFTFGKNKDINKSPSINTTDKSDRLGYGATVAFPYRFSKYSAITAGLHYEYSQDKTDASKQKENRYGLDIHLEDYLAYNHMKCDPHTGFKLSLDKYDQGSGFIDYETRGSFFTGNSTTTYTVLPGSYKNKLNTTNLDVSGSYYIINHIAIGGRLRFSHSVEKADDNSFRITGNAFEFDPEIIINAPVKNGWRNLFVKGGGYFGSSKSEVKITGNTDINKLGISGYNVGIGYYAFLAGESALKTCIYYRSLTNKQEDTNDKFRYRGFAVDVGIVHSF